LIEPEPFAMGLTRIGLSLRQTYTAEEQFVYFEALATRTTAEEWARFARETVAAGRWTRFLPTVAELVDVLEEFRGKPPLEAEAAIAYDRVIAAANYTPEGGSSWTFREVRARCGAAAARAFLEAGGHHAFATTWDESRRRERFLAAYQAEARERPAERLLPEGAAPLALPSGEPAPLSEHEAARFMRRVREMAGGAHGQATGDGMVRATDERLALLRAQAQEIAASAAEET
jgi:hypothetical protein